MSRHRRQGGVNLLPADTTDLSAMISDILAERVLVWWCEGTRQARQRGPSVTAMANVVEFKAPGGIGFTEVKSIQGEQQSKVKKEVVWADPDDVDAYVDDADEGDTECRDRGRHLIPRMKRKADMREMFTELDDDDNPIRRVVCTCCKKAEQVERWSFNSGRLEPVSSYLWYPAYLLKPGQKPYTVKPGTGRIRPRDVRASVATSCVAGWSEKKFQNELKKAFK